MRVENDLKPHNMETVERILEFFENGNKCCAIQATGTGKSFLILRLLEVFNDEDKKAIVLAPNNEIIKQTQKHMKRFGLSNATFYTYQKLSRMTEEEIEEIETDLIVCDELHRTGAATWGAKFEILVATHTNAKIFGATATALRCTDGRDMAEEYFDNNRACDISLAEALVRKIIPVMPTYVSALYTFEEEYQKLYDKIENGNNTKEEKEELQKELSAAKKQLEKANGVPEIIKKYITDYNGKYIVFCRDKEHLYEMKDVVTGWFRKSGYKGQIFEYPYYANSTAVKRNLDEFKANTEEGLKLLFVIDKLNEGLHLDEIQGCILLRTTVSNIIYYQQIGRVIDAGTTEKRIILDLVSNFNNLGSFNFKRELQEKIEERQEGKFKECSTDFEVDEFNVVDLIQDCVDVFSNIDSLINGFSYTEDEINIIKEYYSTLGATEIQKTYLPNRSVGSIKEKARQLGLCENKNTQGNYTDKDDEILIKNYSKLGRKGCHKLLPHFSENSIKQRAKNLGLKYDANTWTDNEIEILKRSYSDGVTLDEICNLLPNRSKTSIGSMASKLGITTRHAVPWTREEDNIIREYYPEFGVKILPSLDGRSKDQLVRRASELGIKKGRKYKIAI